MRSIGIAVASLSEGDVAVAWVRRRLTGSLAHWLTVPSSTLPVSLTRPFLCLSNSRSIMLLDARLILDRDSNGKHPMILSSVPECSHLLCTYSYFRAQALIDLIDSCTATRHSKNDSQLWLRQLHEARMKCLDGGDTCGTGAHPCPWPEETS